MTLPPLIELTSQLVAINSVFPNEQQIINLLEQHLTRLGFLVEQVPVSQDRYCLTAVIGNSAQYLCLYGHADTVPPAAEWQQDPFTMIVNGDRASGLGVGDMKGGLAIILHTAAYAAQHNLPLKIAIGVDEENVSLGSQALIQTNFFDDVTLLISAESGQVENDHQDFAINYGRKGRCVIAINIQGRTAHAAQSGMAVNAIEKLGQCITHLQQLSLPSHAQLGSVELIPFRVEGGVNAFSVPDTARLDVNVLTVPGVSSEEILHLIQQAMDTLDIAVTCVIPERETPYMEAYQVDLHHPILEQLSQTVFSQYQATPGYAESVADENRFAEHIEAPVISIGPIEGGDHTSQEWLSLTSLETTSQVYQQILTTLHSSEQQDG